MTTRACAASSTCRSRGTSSSATGRSRRRTARNGFDCSPGNSMQMTKTYEPLPRGFRMMSEFLRYTIFGLAFAGVYFIAASGLVVTYTASGIFNFAHGAVAMIAAFTYWELRVEHHWPAPLAFAAVLLVEAPIMGVVIERVVMRNLGGAATITNIVVTIGLLVTLLGIGSVVWAPSKFAETPSLPRFFQAERRDASRGADPVALLLRARHLGGGRVRPVDAARGHPPRHRHAGGRRRPQPRTPQRREPGRRVGRQLGRRLHARRAGRRPARAHPRARRRPPHLAGDQRVRRRGRRPPAQPPAHGARRGDPRAGSQLLRLGPRQDAARAGVGAERPRLAADHHVVRRAAGAAAGSHPAHARCCTRAARRSCRRCGRR